VTLEGFYHLLTWAAPVTATVEGRIHYGHKPQGERAPSIVLQLITETPGIVMNGPAPYRTGIVRLNCFASTLLAAGDLADAVRGAVHGYSGTVNGFTFGSVIAGGTSEIPRVVPDGQSGPAVFGVLMDCNYVLKT